MRNSVPRSVFLTATAALLAAPRRARAATNEVAVAYAGSLVTAMEKSIGPAFAATGFTYKGEGKGSVALANLIREGLRVPDVFISADPAVIETLRGPAGHDAARWYATFAATRMVLGYSPKSRYAREFAAAAAGKRPWTSLFDLPGIRAARTDPALDPKGYRVMLVMQLAERAAKAPGLAERVLGDARNPEQVFPEEDALARLEGGEADAIWLYSVEAVSRRLPAIELGPAVDLGDPRFLATYATASVTIKGIKRTGAPILYALTIPTSAPNPQAAAAFVSFLVGRDGRALQQKAGLVPLKPIVYGDRAAVPAALSNEFTSA